MSEIVGIRIRENMMAEVCWHHSDLNRLLTLLKAPSPVIDVWGDARGARFWNKMGLYDRCRIRIAVRKSPYVWKIVAEATIAGKGPRPRTTADPPVQRPDCPWVVDLTDIDFLGNGQSNCPTGAMNPRLGSHRKNWKTPW